MELEPCTARVAPLPTALTALAWNLLFKNVFTCTNPNPDITLTIIQIHYGAPIFSCSLFCCRTSLLLWRGGVLLYELQVWQLTVCKLTVSEFQSVSCQSVRTYLMPCPLKPEIFRQRGYVPWQGAIVFFMVRHGRPNFCQFSPTNV